MKWICTIVGSVIVLVGIILSPWPEFILDVANEVLRVPEAADDIVFHNIVKVLAAVVTYVFFPAFGGGLGFVLGYFWERKYD
ncbi:hypothetical protein ACFLVW_01125 [Chloroflexota bacterium]